VLASMALIGTASDIASMLNGHGFCFPTLGTSAGDDRRPSRADGEAGLWILVI